jgi:hypothetical protein
MRNSDDSPQRYQIIQQMQEQVRHDAPWVFGFHPKNFVLSHHWYQNLKPNLMANNRLKYARINPTERLEKRQAWNKAVLWPFILIIVVFLLSLLPVLRAYQQRLRSTLK